MSVSQFIFISLFNVVQHALLIQRNAVCINECMCECYDKPGVFFFNFRIQ